MTLSTGARLGPYALTGMGELAMTADGGSYAYTFGRAAGSDLYLLEGAK